MNIPILIVRDEAGNIIEIPALQGKKGDKGDDYVLTATDKQEIAQIVYSLLQNGDEVSY